MTIHRCCDCCLHASLACFFDVAESPSELLHAFLVVCAFIVQPGYHATHMQMQETAREWKNPPYNFDNLGMGLMSLFVTVTLNGYLGGAG